MVDKDLSPDAGGNTDQPDDGRDDDGRLPEPLDSAHYPPVEGGPAINVPGMPVSQPAGLGPVVSSPPPKPAQADAEAQADDGAAAPEPAEEPAKKPAKKPGGMTTMPRAGG